MAWRGRVLRTTMVAIIACVVVLGLIAGAGRSPQLHSRFLMFPEPVSWATAAQLVLWGVLFVVIANYAFALEGLLVPRSPSAAFAGGLTRRLAVLGLGGATWMQYEEAFLAQMRGFEQYYDWVFTVVLGLLALEALVFTARGILRLWRLRGSAPSSQPPRRAIPAALRVGFLATCGFVVIAGFFMAVDEAQRRDRAWKQHASEQVGELLTVDYELWSNVSEQTTANQLAQAAVDAAGRIDRIRQSTPSVPPTGRLNYLRDAVNEACQGYAVFARQLAADLDRAGEVNGDRSMDVHLKAVGHAQQGLDTVTGTLATADGEHSADPMLIADAELLEQMVARLDGLHDQRAEAQALGAYGDAFKREAAEVQRLDKELKEMLDRISDIDNPWRGLVEMIEEPLPEYDGLRERLEGITPPDEFLSVHGTLIAAVTKGRAATQMLARHVSLRVEQTMRGAAAPEEAERDSEMARQIVETYDQALELQSAANDDFGAAMERYEQVAAPLKTDLREVALGLRVEA